MSQDLKINKGVELMLRRDRKPKEPERKGLKVRQTLSLFGKRIEFNFELTWGEHN